MIAELSIDTDALRFHALAAGRPGDGLLLLLHGFPESSHAWTDYLEPLAAQGYHVVAPDQRGYGRSEKPRGVASYHIDVLCDDVVSIAAALGHDRFAVVGHDWGGIVAWRLAGRDDTPVERLAIANAPNLDVFRAHLLRHPLQWVRSAYVGLFQLPLVPEVLLGAAGHAALAQSLRATSRPGTFTDGDLDTYRSAWSQPGALTGMLNWYRALPTATSRPARPIACPTLIVWGDRDTALDRSLAAESAALCARVTVAHLPDATHWLLHEEAERVTRLLAGWLDRPMVRKRT